MKIPGVVPRSRDFASTSAVNRFSQDRTTITPDPGKAATENDPSRAVATSVSGTCAFVKSGKSLRLGLSMWARYPTTPRTGRPVALSTIRPRTSRPRSTSKSAFTAPSPGVARKAPLARRQVPVVSSIVVLRPKRRFSSGPCHGAIRFGSVTGALAVSWCDPSRVCVTGALGSFSKAAGPSRIVHRPMAEEAVQLRAVSWCDPSQVCVTGALGCSRSAGRRSPLRQFALGVPGRVEDSLASTAFGCGCLVVGSVPVARDHKPRASAGSCAAALNGMQSSKIAFDAMSESV
jgi:hypothetical protein